MALILPPVHTKEPMSAYVNSASKGDFPQLVPLSFCKIILDPIFGMVYNGEKK